MQRPTVKRPFRESLSRKDLLEIIRIDTNDETIQTDKWGVHGLQWNERVTRDGGECNVQMRSERWRPAGPDDRQDGEALLQMQVRSGANNLTNKRRQIITKENKGRGVVRGVLVSIATIASHQWDRLRVNGPIECANSLTVSSLGKAWCLPWSTNWLPNSIVSQCALWGRLSFSRLYYWSNIDFVF